MHGQCKGNYVFAYKMKFCVSTPRDAEINKMWKSKIWKNEKMKNETMN